MKLKNIFLGLGLSCLINTVSAQNGLEGIIVERYYQTNAADGTNATANGATLATGSVVYRVYVDMAAGYKFVQTYGSASHNLKIATSTNFFNDPNYGVATNPLTISATNIKKNTAMIDSWLTVGGASNSKAGVMKSEDSDGTVGNTNSLLTNNAGGCYGLPITGTSSQDGMIASTSQTAIAPSILGISASQLGLFDQTSGSDFTVNNGSIAALGGIVGPTSSNRVLIGQFTTDGTFTFQLNVQLLSPSGVQEKWVANNPVTGEYTHASLSSPTYTYAGNITGTNNLCLTGNTGTTLTLNGSVGNIQWQKATITAGVVGTFANITGATTSTLATGALTASTAYRANLSFGTCNSINSSNYTVTVNPVAVAGTAAVNDASGLTVCSGGSKALKITGNVGSIQWQKSTDGGTTWSNVTGATTSPYTFSNITTNTSYRAVITSGVCATTATSNVLAITTASAPVAGTVSADVSTICSGGSSTLTLTGSSGTIAWQKATVTAGVVGTFATATGTTNSLSTGALTATTAYRAVLTSSPCTQAISPQIIINVDKAAVAGTISAATSVCTAGDITLSLTGYTGTSFQWQSSATSAGTYTDIVGATSSTYTVSNATSITNKNYKVKVTSGVCTTTVTSAVKSFLVDVPTVAGTVSGGAAICSAGGGLLSLTGNTGATIQWQSSTDNGATWANVSGATTASYTASNLLADTKYRASVKNGACLTKYTSPVTFTIVSSPVAGTITGEQYLCIWNNATTLTLNNNVGSISWQKSTNWTVATPTWTAVTGTTATLETGAITASTAYRATVSIGACATAAQTSNFIVTVGQYIVSKAITASVTTPTGATSATALCTSNTSKVLTLGAGYVGDIQWQKYSSTTGWTNIAGATSATYTITNPTAGGNFFRVKLSVGDCSEGYSTNVMGVWYKNCLVQKIETNDNLVNDENVKVTTEKSMLVEENNMISFDAVAFPNPFENHFTINLLTDNQDHVMINLFDMSGKVLEKYTVSPFEVENLQIGMELTSGIYNVLISQGNSVKTLRLIKQ